MAEDRDDLFAQRGDVASFSFDAAVARVFPDMIRRSVPGYDAQLHVVSAVARHYATAGARLYDLGCSLGGATLALIRGLTVAGCEIVGVDNSPAMLERARAVVAAQGAVAGQGAVAAPSEASAEGGDSPSVRVSFVEADLADYTLSDACVVVFNYTLQFLPIEQRLGVLRRIRAGMATGGALVLAEKTTREDPSEAALLEALHLDFKRGNRYSELEIANKRTALERVLIAETPRAHEQRLLAAGFREPRVVFQCLNFTTWLARA